MNFDPKFVISLLENSGVQHLYHANSVATSCSLLKIKSLCSRNIVETRSLSQTPQVSDDIDKQFGLWDCVFLDTDDLHRAFDKYNFYGPVLFIFHLKLLLLASKEGVRITKKNPIHWSDKDTSEDRWFCDESELKSKFKIHSDYMIVIPSPEENLAFEGNLRQITIDDPQQLVKGSNGFDLARHALEESSAENGLILPAIHKRACIAGCECLHDYKKNYSYRDRMFTP